MLSATSAPIRTLLTRPTLAKGKNANISTDNRNSWSSSRLWNIIEASSFPVENMSRNYQILYSCQLLWPLSSSLEIPNFIPYRLKETILLKISAKCYSPRNQQFNLCCDQRDVPPNDNLELEMSAIGLRKGEKTWKFHNYCFDKRNSGLGSVTIQFFQRL